MRVQEIYDRCCVWCDASLEERRANAKTCSSACRSQLSRARAKFVDLFHKENDEIAWMLIVPVNVHQHFSSIVIGILMEIENHVPNALGLLFLQGARAVESTDSTYQASLGWMTLCLSFNLFPKDAKARFKEVFCANVSK